MQHARPHRHDRRRARARCERDDRPRALSYGDATGHDGRDGTFTLESTACGEYTVFVFGTMQPVKVDVRKQPSFVLTISSSVAENARDFSERQVRLSTPRRAAVSEADRDDERAAAAYRERFIATVGTPADRRAFAAAPPDGQAQAFVAAVTRSMLSGTDLVSATPSSRPSRQTRGQTRTPFRRPSGRAFERVQWRW
jgi:hypothetical protein